ncbi:hypothetical protein DFH08DRAFT_889397 [Mycena albidolilacea]|uniref:Uncharacterized protein n=1 Tax=Mycena albidolilacea TaxID=1033008 RepID=A0AAD6ZGD0_9AGAR|nr:hypothetical protein DFH08DRAFT_889397 [Mycena albidolilacea]
MSATNTVVQRTLFGRIADEEQGFPDTRSNTRSSEPRPKMEPDSEAGGTVYKMAARFMRKGKRKIGVVESLKATTFSSWLNLLLLFDTFVLCFLAIIRLEKLFDYGGEQMAFYLGEDLGDLSVVTLNNTVEASLAIILVKKCELKLLQSTVVGGARVLEQDLHPHLTQLNHILPTIGVMTLLLPAGFFAALNHGSSAAPEADSFINPTNRHVFLQMSRELAVILLPVYICHFIIISQQHSSSMRTLTWDQSQVEADTAVRHPLCPVLEHVPVLPSPDWGLIQANRPERIEHLSAKELRDRVAQLTESLGPGQRQILVHNSILEASNAQLMIQNIFVRKQSTALHAKEDKKSKKGPKAYIDSKGWHLTSTEYIEALEAAEQQKIEEEEAKADRTRAKEKKKGARAALATEWERIKAAHLVSVQQWEEKCAELTGMGKQKKDLPRKPKQAKKPELPKDDDDDDESDGGSDGGSGSE